MSNIFENQVERKLYEREAKSKIVCTRVTDPRGLGSDVDVFQRFIYLSAEDMDSNGQEGWALISEVQAPARTYADPEVADLCARSDL